MDSENKATTIIFACFILLSALGFYFMSQSDIEKEKTKQLEIRLKFSHDSTVNNK